MTFVLNVVCFFSISVFHSCMLFVCNAVINKNSFVSQLLCQNEVLYEMKPLKVMRSCRKIMSSSFAFEIWRTSQTASQPIDRPTDIISTSIHRRFVIVMFDQRRVRQRAFSWDESYTSFRTTNDDYILNCTRSDPLTGFHAYISLIVRAVFHFPPWWQRRKKAALVYRLVSQQETERTSWTRIQQNLPFVNIQFNILLMFVEC